MDKKDIAKKLARAIPLLTVPIAVKIVNWVLSHPQIITAFRQLVEQEDRGVDGYLDGSIGPETLLEQGLDQPIRYNTPVLIDQLVDQIRAVIDAHENVKDIDERRTGGSLVKFFLELKGGPTEMEISQDGDDIRIDVSGHRTDRITMDSPTLNELSERIDEFLSG